jgi:transcription antitermination factor NusG
MGAYSPGWPWFAIQVKTCAEKAATTVLQYKGYECFLPLGKSRRHWSDRIKELEVPLFPGYLFCRFNPYDRLPILKTPGVIQVLGIGKNLTPVDDDEIGALQCVGKTGLSVEPWPFMQVGDIARIEHGPLRGLTGIVITIKSELKVILSVTLLRRSVAVEVEGGWLRDPRSLSREATVVKSGPSAGLAPNHLARGHRGFPSRPIAAD